MMDSVNIIDPKSGQAHAIPFDQLPNALKAGGMYADEEQKQKAIQYGRNGQSEIPETPFNGRPTPPKEETGLAGLASDTADMFSNALNAGANWVDKVPDNIGKIKQDVSKNGIGHLLGQLHASNADLVKSTINSPHDFVKYMLKKNLAFDIPIPGTKLGFPSDLIPHIPEDTGAEKFFGTKLNPEKGDEFTRALEPIIAAGAGAVSGVKSLAGAIGKPVKNVLKTRKLEAQISNAADAMGLSEAKTEKLKNVLREKFSEEHGKKIGELTPTGQKVEVNVKKHNIGELAPDLAIPKKDVGEIPPKPSTEHLTKKIDADVAASEEARKSLETDLGVKGHPTHKAGSIVKAAITSVKKNASDLYNAGRKIFADEHVLADNDAEIKSVTSDLNKLKDEDELAAGYGHGSDEQKALEASLEALKGEKVAASDVFDLQQHAVKLAKRYRDKAYAPGVSQLENTHNLKLADRMQAHADKLATRLESVGGKDVQKMFTEANKGWRTYHQAKKNTVGSMAWKKGEVPSDALINIAREEDGNAFMQSLVENDPELKKHFLAAHIGSKGLKSGLGKFDNPEALVHKYMMEVPGIEGKVKAFQRALSKIKETKSETKAEIKNLNDKHKALESAMKDEANKQATRQKAEKEHAILQAEIKSHEKAIPKLEARMKEHDITVAEHAKLKKELKAHKDALADKNPRLKNLMGAVLRITGASTVAHKFGLH